MIDAQNHHLLEGQDKQPPYTTAKPIIFSTDAGSSGQTATSRARKSNSSRAGFFSDGTDGRRCRKRGALRKQQRRQPTSARVVKTAARREAPALIKVAGWDLQSQAESATSVTLPPTPAQYHSQSMLWGLRRCANRLLLEIARCQIGAP